MSNFANNWVVLVNVVPLNDINFSELIEENNKNRKAVGAWTYVFAKSDEIEFVPKVVENPSQRKCSKTNENKN